MKEILVILTLLYRTLMIEILLDLILRVCALLKFGETLDFKRNVLTTDHHKV